MPSGMGPFNPAFENSMARSLSTFVMHDGMVPSSSFLLSMRNSRFGSLQKSLGIVPFSRLPDMSKCFSFAGHTVLIVPLKKLSAAASDSIEPHPLLAGNSPVNRLPLASTLRSVGRNETASVIVPEIKLWETSSRNIRTEFIIARTATGSRSGNDPVRKLCENEISCDATNPASRGGNDPVSLLWSSQRKSSFSILLTSRGNSPLNKLFLKFSVTNHTKLFRSSVIVPLS
mmetsp:Transcript_14819/g.24515  ORF Transcript_14819/g.24515 Transcript_14819/m.24515 type:complete len:230 (-) Transcript_14819:119-808(-)